MGKNKLITATAGSGKTSLLVEEALKIKDERVLIVTYTRENELGIKKRFWKKLEMVPKNIEIQTWYSFLLKHAVRPYQGFISQNYIEGIEFKFGGSSRKKSQYIDEKSKKIYSDNVSKFALECNEKSKKNLVIDRIKDIYPHIFIDEAQDLAGYDFELISLLASTDSRLLFVCDPKQRTYKTNNNMKNSKITIEEFIEKLSKKLDFEIDKETLKASHRFGKPIATFVSKLYPKSPTDSCECCRKYPDDGLFLVKGSDVAEYLKRNPSVQLRWNAEKNVEKEYEVYNFGEAKGLEFDNVLIYPTKDMIKYLKNGEGELKDQTKARFYVGITRSRNRVAFVMDCDSKFAELKPWNPFHERIL